MSCERLREIPVVAVEVSRVVLAFAVHVVSGFGEDDGAGLAGALAVCVRILNADLNDVRAIGHDIALGDGEAAFAGTHLNTVVGDAQADGKPERLHEPVCGGGGIRVDENGNDGAGRDGAVGEHAPNVEQPKSVRKERA